MSLSLPQKILGQTYEKLSIRSNLGTSEENLTLNLRKNFDQCSIRSFGSANGVDVIYLDYRKAFDTVPHKRLLT